MPSIRNILQLIRFPNLVIIAATLLAVRYLVIVPEFFQMGVKPAISTPEFILIVANAMIIAAGGYILNDVFDIEIDRINHPDRMIIEKVFSRNEGVQIAVILLLLAFCLGIIISLRIASVLPALVFLVAILVVWWYAARLKKTLIWGNLAVACMTACTIGMIWLFELDATGLIQKPVAQTGFVSKIILSVMIFAGGLNFVREIVKDMEDMQGDSMVNCRSLPVVAGIKITHWVVNSLTLFILILLVVSQVWLWNKELKYVSGWLMVMVVLPLIVFLLLVNRAETKQQYHRASSFLRWIMVLGLATLVVLHLNQVQVF
jgi:4-hydroxybenzoate polyprenyltransferase